MPDEKPNHTPAIGKTSFACPFSSCGVVAEQKWYTPWVSSFTPSVIENTTQNTVRNRTLADYFAPTVGRLKATESPQTCYEHVDGANISVCNVCKKATIWLAGKIIYPLQKTSLQPHPDMPPEIAEDFIEAVKVVDASPRSACGLARLSVQKLCDHLLPGDGNLNTKIGKMVTTMNLSIEVQRALDIVRVTGAHALHPLTMDLTDDRKRAVAILELVNDIVNVLIAEPKRRAAIFAEFTPGEREQIAKRDAPK